MSAFQREILYKLFKRRLFSYYEVLPGRFAAAQWRWINENLPRNMASRTCSRASSYQK